MVKNIVRLFFDLSEKHKLIKSFKYDRLSKGAGVGDELMPHVFLEDPIYFGETNMKDGVVPVTVNLDIVVTPQFFENYSIYPSTEGAQNLCYEIGLNFISRLKYLKNEYDWLGGVVSWSWITLKHWYDNDCDGVRFTIVLNVKNEIDFCNTDEHFDPEKEFDTTSLIPSFETDDAMGCAVFDNKLSKFDL